MKKEIVNKTDFIRLSEDSIGLHSDALLSQIIIASFR